MKKRRRYTLKYKPTGAGKAMLRGMGIFHAVFGTVFAIAAVTVIIPSAGLFGILFLAAGVFFAVNGTLIAFGKDGLIGRSYEVETEMEGEIPEGSSVQFTSSSADIQRRLEQLESLKEAGLISEQEYQEKRREILEEL